MAEPSRVPSRSDAVANRERILDTAERYFAEHGLGAPLQGLAAAADVGAGTLYRNFASQAELVQALYSRYVPMFDRIAVRAESRDSGWAGIELILHECVATLIDLPIIADVMRQQAENDPDYRPSQRWVGPLTNIVARAIAEGSARADLTAADVGSASFMLAAMRNVAPQNRGWVSGRLTALLLDGMRAHPHQPGSLPPLPDGFVEGGGSIVRRPT